MSWRIRALLGALVLLAALAPKAGAQGVIRDLPAVFERPVSAFDASPAAHFTGVSSDPMDDHVFATGWWYRLAGDTAEKFLPTPDAQSYVNNTSVITWNDVDGRGFRAVETAVVTNGGGPSGQVVFTLNLTNLSETAPLSIDVFHMSDIEGGSSAPTESATLLTPNELIGVSEGPDTAQYGGRGAAAFLVLTSQNSSGLPDVGTRLSDLVLDNFDNSGLPFGPNDVTAGFQWVPVVIPPSGSTTFVAGIAVNMTLSLPAPGATTTTFTTVSTTTSTTLDSELCDNCSDDDGDGLVDFEDTDCCAAAPMTLKKSSLRSRGQGLTTLKLAAKLATSPIADGTTATQDLTVQLRDATGVFCARVPAGSLTRRKKGLVFRDQDGTVTSARGIERVTLTAKGTGAKLAVAGREAQLATPAAGSLTVTLGLRDPATAEAANQCTTAIATFRATKKGLRYP